MKDHIKVREPSESLRRKVKNGGQQDSLLREFANENITIINIDDLIPFRGQPRINFDEEKIKYLSESIREHGLRQPLTVIASEEDSGKYEVVSGERRLRALKKLSYDKVPCIIIFDMNKAEEIALAENIQREDLHPIELGKSYKKLCDHGYTQQRIADKLSVPRTQVVEYIKFSNIPVHISEELIKHNIIKRSFLRKISAIEDSQMQELYLAEVLKQDKNRQIINRSNLLKINYKWGKLEIDRKNLEKCPSEVLQQLYSELVLMSDSIKKLLSKDK